MPRTLFKMFIITIKELNMLICYRVASLIKNIFKYLHIVRTPSKYILQLCSFKQYLILQSERIKQLD